MRGERGGDQHEARAGEAERGGGRAGAHGMSDFSKTGSPPTPRFHEEPDRFHGTNLDAERET